MSTKALKAYLKTKSLSTYETYFLYFLLNNMLYNYMSQNYFLWNFFYGTTFRSTTTWN